jgi:hypothetical protein
MVVGWQLRARMRTDPVLDAPKMALGLRGPPDATSSSSTTATGDRIPSID